MIGGYPANIERFRGFADRYDRYRPAPPAVLVDLLTQLAQAPRPKLAVDIGSGTGLATRLWAGRAEKTVGIEPNGDMRRQAEAATAALGIADVSYCEGTSTHTGLPDGCADIVTCVQALHWMDPAPTFAEVARILRPGGVFAACDCDWPPTMHRQAEAAYAEFSRGVHRLEAKLGVSRDVRKWPKAEHLIRMAGSGQFLHVKEILLHQVEPGSAERLVGLATSMGGVAGLLKQGLSAEKIGLTRLREAAERFLGSEPRPWYFSYRARVGLT